MYLDYHSRDRGNCIADLSVLLAPLLEQCSSVQASLEFCTKFVFYVFCVTRSCILLAPLLGGAQIIVSILTLVSFSMGFFSVLFVLCESGRTDFIHLSCCTPDLNTLSVLYVLSKYSMHRAIHPLQIFRNFYVRSILCCSAINRN